MLEAANWQLYMYIINEYLKRIAVGSDKTDDRFKNYNNSLSFSVVMIGDSRQLGIVISRWQL